MKNAILQVKYDQNHLIEDRKFANKTQKYLLDCSHYFYDISAKCTHHAIHDGFLWSVQVCSTYGTDKIYATVIVAKNARKASLFFFHVPADDDIDTAVFQSAIVWQEAPRAKRSV